MDSLSFKRKAEKILKAAGKEIDSVLIYNTGMQDPNFLYLTGFTSGLFEYSALLLTKTGVALATSPLEYETAKAQAPKGLDVVCINTHDELIKFMTEQISGKKLGINGSFLPYNIYKSIKSKYTPTKIADVSEKLLSARLVKDAEEISKIRKAVGITKMAMVLVQKEFVSGITEMGLASKFDRISASLGSSEPSFKTIVCFGKNSSMPHHFPGDTKLALGDFVLIDAGAKVDNYCSDMTRTFVFGAEANEAAGDKAARMTEMMDVVKQAQLKAIHSIKPGTRGMEIDRIARDYIETFGNGKYKGTFIHSLGHSLGIEVHDGPGFSPNEKTIIKRGMVITVEPGIYINGFGGVRIEDDILVTDEGALVL